MQNLRLETLIHLSEVAKRIPPGRGKKIHTSTVFRWIRSGALAAAGQRIYLESVRIGRYSYTTIEALDRFIAAMSSSVGAEAPTIVRSPSQRKSAAQRADQELKKLGVGD